MPRGQSSNEESRLPVLVDPRLLRAVDHRLRQHILLAAVQGPVSPKELSDLLNEELSAVSYHMNVLHKECDEVVELVGTRPRRGALEHFYRASAKTLLPAKMWRGAKKGLRAVVGAGQASDLFNELAAGLGAGKLQGGHDHIARTLLVLDAKGRRKVKAIAERAIEEVEDEQVAAVCRMEKAKGAGGKATAYTFGVLAFEPSWEPVDLHAQRAGTKSAGTEPRSGAAARGGSQGKRNGRKAGAGEK